jgi:hypothetical protein
MGWNWYQSTDLVVGRTDRVSNWWFRVEGRTNRDRIEGWGGERGEIWGKRVWSTARGLFGTSFI